MEEVKILFLYNGHNEEIKYKKGEIMNDIYKRYVMKIQVELEKLFFYIMEA